MKTYRVGTRKSNLARIQTQSVMDALVVAGLSCEMVEVGSQGDKDLKTPLYEMEAPTPGVFTKLLEKALLNREIDLAVHSLKDLPTLLPSGLTVAALSPREKSGDCLLVSPEKFAKDENYKCAHGASVGTSSLRRQAELLSSRPDLKVASIRGNIETRIRAVQEAKVDAVVLARAGLERLKLALEKVLLIDLPEEIFVPAPGQGVLAIETRLEEDGELGQALSRFHNVSSEVETRVERSILRALEGGCTLPLGVRCYVRSGDKDMKLKAFLGLSKEPRSGRSEWKSFHHFDISDGDEGALIEKTVSYFKNVIEGEK